QRAARLPWADCPDRASGAPRGRLGFLKYLVRSQPVSRWYQDEGDLKPSREVTPGTDVPGTARGRPRPLDAPHQTAPHRRHRTTSWHAASPTAETPAARPTASTP